MTYFFSCVPSLYSLCSCSILVFYPPPAKLVLERKDFLVKVRVFVLAALLLALLVFMAGCGSAPAAQKEQSGSGFSFQDDTGRTLALAKKPTRIVVLTPSLLEPLYAVGGQAIGRAASRLGDIPEAAKGLPEVGFVYQINSEAVLALSPDLVLGFQGMHENLIPLFQNAGVPVALLRLKGYEDLLRNIRLLGKLSGDEAKAQAEVARLETAKEALQKKLPQASKRIVILHATAKQVTVELPNSLTGDMANLLKVQNVAAGSQGVAADATAVPYSLETLVQQDPDMILITSMGSTKDIEKRMRDDVMASPAWSSLRAVKSGQLFFLPPEWFQVHPGLKYDAALLRLAQTMYPEVYGHAP